MTISLERAPAVVLGAPPEAPLYIYRGDAGHGGSGSGPTPAGPSHSTSPGCTSPRRYAAITTR